MTKHVKVLGSGCSKCRATAEAIRTTAATLGVVIELEKIEDFAQIASFGVMAVPGVVVDGVVVHTGSVPNAQAIERWIR